MAQLKLEERPHPEMTLSGLLHVWDHTVLCGITKLDSVIAKLKSASTFLMMLSRDPLERQIPFTFASDLDFPYNKLASLTALPLRWSFPVAASSVVPFDLPAVFALDAFSTFIAYSNKMSPLWLIATMSFSLPFFMCLNCQFTWAHDSHGMCSTLWGI